MVGQTFGQEEEHKGAASEGAPNEDEFEVEERDVMDRTKLGEEDELEEGLLVLYPNPGHGENREICPMFMIICRRSRNTCWVDVIRIYYDC